jgi:PBSX family phage terminase large subunit
VLLGAPDQDVWALTKFKPLVRGKQRDSMSLSEPGMATGHFWEGAVRSSKTIVSILRWLEFIVHGPPGPLAMIGRTERTLKRNVLDTIVTMIGPKRCRVLAGSGTAWILGREVYLAGADNLTAVARVQGMTLVGFYGDEVPTWPDELFNMARTRCSEPGAEWFGTGNPASSTHHLKTDWIDRAKLHLQRDGRIIHRSGKDVQDIHVYSFTIYDNPHLTAKFVTSLETSYVGMFYRRYVLGEWCMAEGAIYDAWDPDKHVITPAQLPEIERWISVGVDPAITHPFSAVSLGLGDSLSGEGKALYATAEFRYDQRTSRRKLTDLEYAKKLQIWLPEQGSALGHAEPEAFVVDPAAAGFRQQLQRLDMFSRAADKDVLAGIGTVASVIAAPGRFYVSSACKGLILERPSYSWDDKAAKMGIDKPIKIGDDSMDAERYAAHTPRSAWWHDLFPDRQDED